MNRFSTLLLTSLLAGSIGACSDDPAPVTDSGVPSDTGGGADTGVCTPTPIADPTPDMTSCSAPPVDGGPVPYFQCTTDPVCPRGRFMNNAMRPGFRLTYLKITQPAALASAAILSTINPTLQRGTFIWGLQFDLTANTFRTGGLNPMFTRGSVGVGLMDGQYAFFNNNGPAGSGARYNPVSGPVMVTGTRAATTTVTTTVNIPIFSDEAGTMLLTQLPMDNTRITNVHLTADRGCIGGGLAAGGRYTETTSRWLTEDNCDQPYGQVDADITVENAKMVNVTIGGNPTPLCNIISGANCMTDPQSGWARQPDTMVNGMPAYHLRANFAAISANIAQ
jgi:hypothetical protein